MNLKMQAELEQLETAMEDFSKFLASYREGLVESKISEPLSDQLIIHFHDIFWTVVLSNGLNNR